MIPILRVAECGSRHPAGIFRHSNAERRRPVAAPASSDSSFGLALLLLFCACTFVTSSEVTLEECYVEAAAKNHEIQLRRAEIERATGTRWELAARAMPRVTSHVQAGWREGTQYEPDGWYGIINATAAQPIFDAGIPFALRRGKTEVAIARQNLNVAVNSTLHELRITFLHAVALRDLIHVHEEIEKRLDANAKAQRDRLEVGTANRQSLRQAEVQLLAIKPTLARLRRDYADRRVRLAELLGRDVSDPARLPVPAGELRYEFVALDIEKELTRARAGRPDLALLREWISATADDRRIAQAGYLPFGRYEVTLLYYPEDALTSRDTELVRGQESRSSEYRHGPAFTWRVIDNGLVFGASRRLQAARESHEITLRKIEQNLPREIARVGTALNDAQARLAALDKSITHAESNLKLVETRLLIGHASQLDFLFAQRDLLSVRRAVIEAIFEQKVALAELDRVTGRYLAFGEAGKE